MNVFYNDVNIGSIRQNSLIGGRVFSIDSSIAFKDGKHLLHIKYPAPIQDDDLVADLINCEKVNDKYVVQFKAIDVKDA